MAAGEQMELDWLKRWAKISPNKTALKDLITEKEISYREFFSLSQSLALAFREQHQLVAGDRVAVMAKNSWVYVILFYALQRLGVIMVPVNFRLTSREVRHILSDSGSVLFIAEDQFLNECGTKQIAMLPFSALLSMVHSAGQTETNLQFADVAFEHPCMILYTSGTTGAPKGALITHKMLFWNSVNTSLRLNISESDKHISFLPFFHTGGWNVLLTPFIHRGATTLILEKFDADLILKYSEQERATLLFGVPTMMDMMAQSPGFASADLSSVRYAIVGGEPMPVPLIRTWQDKGIAIRQGYGLTEFGPNVFSLNQEDSLRKIGSIGFANFYIQTKVVDDSGREVRPGDVGELLLQGPVCTPGYWNNPAATAETIKDGWLHTGDLVRYDEDGYFYVSGRKKDMFISGGENVYPPEVEQVLRSHPAVREAAVVGILDPKWGEVGRAFLSVKAESAVSGEEILQYCQSRLAKFKIPKSVVFLPDLPKGDSGKILKRALPMSDLQGTAISQR